jgi:hypothetical protein
MARFDMTGMRQKSTRVSWALASVVALGLFASIGALLDFSLSKTNSASGSLTLASFSGSCEASAASGKLTRTQLGSYERLLLGKGGAIEAVVNPRWPGQCAIGATVRQGDFTGGSTTTNRTEFTAPRTLWHSGQSVWYAMSFDLTASSPLPRRGGWMLVHQFFAQDMTMGISGGSPPFAFEITPKGQIRVHVRGGAKSSATAWAPVNHSHFVAPVTRGTWHDLLIHIRWSDTSSGLIQIWQRGSNGAFTSAPQVSISGPNILTVSGDVLPVYAETGIYRSISPTTQTVYYGGLWARADRAEAEPFFASNPS